MQMHEEKLGLLWREFSSSTTHRTLQVILELVLNPKSENGLCQEATQSIL